VVHARPQLSRDPLGGELPTLSYLEASAWAIWVAMAAVVGATIILSAVLMRRLRVRHPEFYREVGEPGVFAPLSWFFSRRETDWWHPNFRRDEQIANLKDPELDRLVRLMRRAQLAALGILCFAILVQLPAAWIISAACESGQLVRICP
jgi:hypothetical protein